MALVRNDSFRDIDRFLKQFWVTPEINRFHAVPMDVYRNGDSFLVVVDLPGVKPASIDLTVEDNVLSIRAERSVPTSVEGVDRTVAERPFGTFQRQIHLGTKVDAENIRANYEDGVLTVVIPIAAHAKPRRIEVAVSKDANAIDA
ncbi:MAG TPA: Hsp20/alpha crystallin family protein [Acidimicrobiales bacterium]|jgi:HSP20 family protein